MLDEYGKWWESPNFGHQRASWHWPRGFQKIGPGCSPSSCQVSKNLLWSGKIRGKAIALRIDFLRLETNIVSLCFTHIAAQRCAASHERSEKTEPKELQCEPWSLPQETGGLFEDLVGGWPTPLKNISSSVGMMTCPIYAKINQHQNIEKDHLPSLVSWRRVILAADSSEICFTRASVRMGTSDCGTWPGWPGWPGWPRHPKFCSRGENLHCRWKQEIDDTLW